MKTLIVIPARLLSKRLPRKLLLNETGKPLIQHTYEAARQAKHASDVVVAADDPEIVDAVRSFGGRAQLTDVSHACGTDRVAEVAMDRTDFDLVVNVQGDEPELSGHSIDLAIQLLIDDEAAVVSTLATRISDRKSLEDPACVKVVFDCHGHALYFSRSPIPCPRQWDDKMFSHQPPCFYQHIGLYAYRREFLLQIPSLPRASTENIESLEQLRVLDAGEIIRVGVVEHPTFGIDTRADYDAFVSRHRN